MLDHDVPQVLVGLADVHALDGLGCLTGVLVTTKASDIKHNNTEYWWMNALTFLHGSETAVHRLVQFRLPQSRNNPLLEQL